MKVSGSTQKQGTDTDVEILGCCEVHDSTPPILKSRLPIVKIQLATAATGTCTCTDMHPHARKKRKRKTKFFVSDP